MTVGTVRTWSWLIFTATLILYMLTSSPDLMYPETIDHTVAVIDNWSVPYIFTLGTGSFSPQIVPRCYSLWLPVARLVEAVPIRTTLCRLSFLSALFGALTLKLLFHIFLLDLSVVYNLN